MRHGLMTWREAELSEAAVRARQARLQAAMRARGLDAVLVYTNHVRPAAVAYLTGFTPYWSDALLIVPAEGEAAFATALSKRGGPWIRANNPTAAILHSPQPGRIAGERLAAAGARRVGVVELDRLPRGLVDEIMSAARAELVEAGDLFRTVRTASDPAEIALARRAGAIAAEAFAAIPERRVTVGDVSGALEFAARRAGAEECYVAAAPDLGTDVRLARRKGDVALGPSFAVRLSVAYHGVWIRRTRTLGREGETGLPAEAERWFDRFRETADPSGDLAAQLQESGFPDGVRAADWWLEAPLGTRPLEVIASRASPGPAKVSYGVLTLRLETDAAPVLLAGPLGLSAGGSKPGDAA